MSIPITLDAPKQPRQKHCSRTCEAVQQNAVLRQHLDLLGELEATNGLVGELTPLTSYLTTAGAVLPTGDPWIVNSEKLRNEWQPQLRDPEKA